MPLNQETRRYFAVGDRDDLAYEDKLAEYRRLSDEYFSADEYAEFCTDRLSYLDEAVLEYVESPEFDDLLVETIARAFPPHEHEQFVAHYRGLLGAWARDQRGAAAPA
jgi:hypothetical protein